MPARSVAFVVQYPTSCQCIQSSAFLAILVSLFANAGAQDAVERCCRILFLNRPAKAPKTLHLFDGVTSQEVELPSMNLSPTYRIAAGALKIRLLPQKVEDPKTVSPDAPAVDIPEAYDDFYLLVTSDANNQVVPVVVQTYHPASAFKPGQSFWINLTDKTIEGKLGEKALTLKSESAEVVDAPIQEEDS